MTVAVRYYSRGGNTKKLADAVARAVGTEAKPISEKLDSDTDVLFLCTAPYAFDVDDEVKSFIARIDVSVKKAVAVSSSAMLKSIRKYLEKPFAEKKIPLSQKEFSCRGQFLVLHRGKPDDGDLKAAADFAKAVVAEEKSGL